MRMGFYVSKAGSTERCFNCGRPPTLSLHTEDEHKGGKSVYIWYACTECEEEFSPNVELVRTHLEQ